MPFFEAMRRGQEEFMTVFNNPDAKGEGGSDHGILAHHVEV